LQLELDGAYLFILFIFFQFSFFLWTKLSLFLVFPFAFIFTSLITHICFSVIENECSTANTSFYRVDWLHQLAAGDGCPHQCKKPTNYRRLLCQSVFGV